MQQHYSDMTLLSYSQLVLACAVPTGPTFLLRLFVLRLCILLQPRNDVAHVVRHVLGLLKLRLMP